MSKCSKKYNVAIVGATGLVGSTFLKVLEEYNFPIKELHLFASSRSTGKEIKYKGKSYYVEELNEKAFNNVDFALFSAGGAISKMYAPIARDAGAYVIDNSSAFRMEADVALIIPEVNLADYLVKSKLIANPNCSTIQSVLPLKPLFDAYGIKRIAYSTYQAVSGSGQKGINDLANTLKGEAPSFYPANISKTCIPQIDDFLDNGYTKEEMKMVNETRKILHADDLPISATCIRVPVENAHGVVISVELARTFELEDIRELWNNYPGIVVVDDPKKGLYPLSTMAAGDNNVYVGRLRRDLSMPNSILFYSVSDNVRKGAAANAVQIALGIVETIAKEESDND